MTALFKIMRIILIGFMGSGKSYFARKLSAALEMDSLDTDSMVETISNRTISNYHEQGDWNEFRKIESEVLFDSPDNCVIATGGGIILRESNRSFLEESNNLVVWLKPELDTLLHRLRDSNRPLIQIRPEKEIIALYKEREALYEECMDIVFTGESITELLTIIKRKIYAGQNKDYN